jgi:hypothetical protein
MRRASTLFAVMLLIAAVCPARAGTIRHDIPAAAFEFLGGLSAFDSVGRIIGTADIGDYSCSGTLIAAQWMLTAAHCVDIAESLEVTINGIERPADLWGAHPDWLSGSLFALLAGNDIGLIHLEEAVTDVTPAQRYAMLDEVGQLGVAVGYGATGTGLTGYDDGPLDGLRRAGTNLIDGYWLGGEESTAFLMDLDRPFFGSPTLFEFLIAPGDSGGAVFLFDEGEMYLAGVNSFLLGLDLVPDADYGDAAGATRVALYNHWIDDVMAGNALLAPSGARAAPLDGSLLRFTALTPAAAVSGPSTLLALLGAALVMAGGLGRPRQH